MNGTPETTIPVVCPECHQFIASSRAKMQWCDCGWSSAPDEWLANYPTGKVKIKIEKDRHRAQRLAEGDTRLLQSLQNPRGNLWWRVYLYLTLLLCAPVLIPGLVFWVFLMAGEIILLVNHAWRNAFIVALFGVGGLAYLLISRSRSDRKDMLLDRSAAPQLFEVLDEVAAHFKAPPINKVYLYLNANASVSQNLKWWPRPHFETRLNLGLLTCQALNVTQLKAVLAHEIGHIKGQDTLSLWIVNRAIQTLQNWGKGTDATIRGVARTRTIFSPFILAGAFIANGLIKIYMALLMGAHLRAMRRQEYLADRGAAMIYGRASLLQALMTIGAVNVKFEQYFPTMVERFDNNLDRHDFYFQFVNLWKNMSEEAKSTCYARAVASFRSVFDTHPSYKDRRKALQFIGSDSVFEDPRSSTDLLPDASESGRQLTIQFLQLRLNRR